MEQTAENVLDLYGSYRHKVDDKGRLSLPSIFRRELPEQLVVTQNPQKECLYVFVPETYRAWVKQLFEDKFGGFNSSSTEHLSLREALKDLAMSAKIDKSGRIMLASSQREEVGIDRDVVLLGNTGYFEIWDAKRYDDKIASIDLSILFS